MELTQPLAFYFPGAVLCVDDNPAFLDGLALNLPHSLNIHTQTNPLTALQTLIAQGNLNHDSSLIAPIDDSDSDEDLDCPVNVYISKIIDIAHEAKRFSCVTVMVVDQSMPEMNGLDLCAKLKGHQVKKIMLTGEPGNTLAIDAFNKGLIDHFIAKKDPHRMAYLESAINNLQQRYFQVCSGLVLSSACAQSSSFLSSPLFLDQFNAFLKDFAICEFYLLDTMGSFLGLDASGKAHWFLVKNKKQMADMCSIAKSTDADPTIIKALHDNAGLIYFLTAKEQNVPVENWDSLLHPITYKAGDFVIAVVEGNISGFDPNVLSFKAFQEKVSDAK